MADVSAFETLEEALTWSAGRLGSLAFVGPDPVYAIGLDAFVPQLVVAAVDDGPALAGLAAAGATCIAVGDSESQGRSALAVLKDERAGALFQRLGVDKALVFKTSHAVHAEAARAGMRLMAPPSALARRWENKVAFVDIGQALGLRPPRSEVVESERATYRDLAARLGADMVVQAPHGYAGARTVLATDDLSFERAKAAARAPVLRVAEFVDGRALTLNACVTEGGVAIGAPFAQLTGLDAFTTHRLGSCGQIWSAAQAPEPSRTAMISAARTIGDALAAEGYRGIFGVDFVVSNGGTPFVIEVNARLVASIAVFTQLELMAGRVPLLLRHLAAFVQPHADHAPLDIHQAPLDGAQVVLHNVSGRDAMIPPDVSGAWRRDESGWHRLESGASTVRVADLAPGDGLVLSGPPGRTIAPGAEWARVQRGPARPDSEIDPEPILELAERLAARLGPSD